MPDLNANGEVALALHKLVQRLSAQLDSTHNEIGQTRHILEDAITRLIPAFTAARMAERSVNGREAHATRAAGTAFSALQFQDMSDQLLAHAQLRLAALQNEMDALAAVLATDSNSHSAETLLFRCTNAHDSLTKLDISLQKPVAEKHLGTGDVEFSKPIISYLSLNWITDDHEKNSHCG